ncbi:LysR family transcriptional regulator [Sulfitobacter sp.]|uniref:LysR family transcriptional regulator n=1 Tax=Sulfitobacter sp. TaxID=1903071 RepID=UPI0030029DD8
MKYNLYLAKRDNEFDLKTLEFYVRVAAAGAIVRAGLEFGFSATTASQRIQPLETQIGCKLLNRTTRSASLSADGELLLAHAKKILADVDDALTSMQGADTPLARPIAGGGVSLFWPKICCTPYW